MQLRKNTFIFLLFVFIASFSIIPINAQSKQKPLTPVTPAGQQLSEFLRAYNTGDLNVLIKFFAAHLDKSALEKRSADERAKANVATFSITRQLKLHSSKQTTDYEIVALCQSEVTEAWFSITLEVAPQPPHSIVKQSFGFANRPLDAVKRGKLSKTQIAKELNIYLEKLAAADMLTGVILVAQNNKPIFKKAYGLIATKTPVRVNTKWDLASLVKMFTSVAIAQLAQQGKLSYNDSIGKFLPNYPNKQAAEKVTLHHLLTHTSGLTEYSDKKEYRPVRDAGNGFKTLKDTFPFFAADPLSFQPGEKSEYNNSNFIILGVIIEKISGQDYFDYIQKRILNPAGMNATEFSVAKANSAGGSLSTVEDLLKFSVALRKHKLLNAKYTDIILSSKVNTGENESYGYGFEIAQINGKKIVGHNGGGSVDNQLDIYLDDGYTVVILSTPFAGRNITRKLRELITQE
jgi:CubicO group peptidase (beta-lactamase class C family)